MYEKFNQPDTLGIISSYPAKNGEVARANAISRYTYLLTKKFPRDQKVVIFSEIKKAKKPFLVSENILVVPTYRLNSPLFLLDILRKSLDFDAISNILIQFEFSIFGGKIIIPQLLVLLAVLKMFGKSINLTFHQVVTDLNSLSGHLAIKKNSVKTKILNSLLKLFFVGCGAFSDKAIVHDKVLAKRLSRFVPEEKIKIIPHGANKEKVLSKSFKNKAKEYFGVNKNTKLVGIFGYCSWYKGTDWLIENFAKFARENTGKKVRLLVAGGESPTLKGTLAYKKYHKKLLKVIKEANGNIVYTGYVPDSDVEKVFGAVDLFIFPYRTKMSASGAFSLCSGYKKPYLVSSAFAENVDLNVTKGRTFNLNYKNFSKVLARELARSTDPKLNIENKSWAEVGKLYFKESLPEGETLPRLSYVEVSEA